MRKTAKGGALLSLMGGIKEEKTMKNGGEMFLKDKRSVG